MARRDHTYGSAGDCTITFSLSSPEGVIVAPTGSMHLDLAALVIYLKTNGVDEFGWEASAGGSGGLPDGDYGDVTISGGGTLITVNDGVITYDKVQDVSGPGLVLGRVSPGAGDIEEIPFSALAAALGVDTSPTGNALLSGGGVAWVQDLDFNVQAASYLIQGVAYSSPADVVTLAAADPTNPRIDIIAVDDTGSVVVLTGTPAATPEAPDVDPSTQLELTFIYVPATATEPDIVVDIIYREDVEWVATSNAATIVVDSPNNPYAGLLDVEATLAVNGNRVDFLAPAPFDPNTKDSLILHIRSKAAWPSAKRLSLTLRQGTTQRGVAVILDDGTFGFSSAIVADYQLVTIPMTAFAAGGFSVDTLRITVSGSGAGIGFYLDNLELQSGISQGGADSTRMRWRGDYSASTAYSQNDVVLHDGVQYVALQGSTGNTPATSPAFWQASSSASASFMRGAAFISSVPLDATQPPVSIAFDRAATITRVVMFSDITGTCAVDIKKSTIADANGGAGGTSIVAGDPPTISTNDYSDKTSFTGWTLSVAAGEALNISITSSSLISRLSVQIFLE